MKTNIYKIITGFFIAGVFMSSCTKKLDVTPPNTSNSETVFATPAGYKQVLAKVYSSYATTGNDGSGSGDIAGIDPGTSDFLRLYWKAQELSTDEAVVAWGDVGIQDFHRMNWTPNNPMLTGLYYRSYYQITLANEFIRQSAPDKVAARNITGTDADNIKKYRVEARFLRAYQYWVLMDLFGSVTVPTETNLILDPPSAQKTRKQVFEYVESELKAIEPDMIGPRLNEYGRADRAAVWALLARLYLNAEVYTGTARNTDAITYSKKVIDGGYLLIDDYRNLMLADNNLNTSEFILTINYDGLKTQNFGGTTFLTHAAIGGDMSAANYGVNSGWGGTRTTKNLPLLFGDYSGSSDQRAQFFEGGQNIEIADLTKFKDGLAVTKYRNKKRNGSDGQDATYADIDFPLFRLPEMYLIYAEAVLRGGTGGDITTAVSYINKIRERAFGNVNNNINSSGLTLNFVLDERARELYWEGQRRTDLIRYHRFTEGTYLWPWKGGVASGTSVGSFRNLYPIPAADINANPNLTQNPGY
ncbi:RagB/SusD family nutrient uptake outer membrane protein [soil metagenome]